MRVRYTGMLPTSVAGVLGEWAPGDVRDVDQATRDRLLRNRWFFDGDDAPEPAPAPTQASEEEVGNGHIAS